MSERDLVDAYLQGKIVSWTFVRRLMKAGVSVATAVAFTALLPAAASSGDLTTLDELVEKASQNNPDEANVLRAMMEQVASGLVRIEKGGTHTHLNRSLIKLSLNTANKPNSNNSADLSFNGGVRQTLVTLNGSLNAPAGGDPNNLQLQLGGKIGDVPVNLSGFVHVNSNGVKGPRGVNVVVEGNVGRVPVKINEVAR